MCFKKILNFYEIFWFIFKIINFLVCFTKVIFPLLMKMIILRKLYEIIDVTRCTHVLKAILHNFFTQFCLNFSSCQNGLQICGSAWANCLFGPSYVSHLCVCVIAPCETQKHTRNKISFAFYCNNKNMASLLLVSIFCFL